MLHECKNFDAIVVGGGFGGCYEVYQLREMGLTVRAFESAQHLGGVWDWNRYPGARVDSEIPYYQLFMEKLLDDFTFTERFPDWKELQRYFRYIDEKLGLSKDFCFETTVVSAYYDTSDDRWVITTKGKGSGTYRARFFVVCTGFATKIYTPQFKGLHSFEGQCYHTAEWPIEGVDCKNKRVGVIGTGASGVQVIQELGPIVKHLTVFQRTPNMALPMRQAKVDPEREKILKKTEYMTKFKGVVNSMGGFDFTLDPRSALDVSSEERDALYQSCWDKGGFRFWVGTFHDVWSDRQANDTAYQFWRSQVIKRIKSPYLKEKLAPEKAPHPFAAKRPSLEQRYFEVYNQPNVTLVDLGDEPIQSITPNGVRTRENEYQFDILVLATGFDAVTGGLTGIDIKGTRGETLAEKWQMGVYTYLGMTTSGFPNLFFMYGPQGPTAFCNGPSCTQCQGDWINTAIKFMITNGYTRMDPTISAENLWKRHVNQLSNLTVIPGTISWYNGSNIPGKTVEALNYLGGLPLYYREIKQIEESNYDGFALY